MKKISYLILVIGAVIIILSSCSPSSLIVDNKVDTTNVEFNNGIVTNLPIVDINTDTIDDKEKLTIAYTS